jgi:hypothetical protein
MNTPLYEDECKNRNFSKFEKDLAESIKLQVEAMQMSDCYRLLKNNSAPAPLNFVTWKRNATNSSSLIDRIIASNSFGTPTAIFNSWGEIISDHAVVTSFYEIESNQITAGPGYLKLNTKVLDDKNLLSEIKSEFASQMSLAPSHWDAHKTLEYAKVIFRSIVLDKSKRHKNEFEARKENLADEINKLNHILDSQDTNEVEKKKSIDLLRSMMADLELMNQQEGQYLAEKCKSTWYSEGSKSNKYFLNLLKSRSNKKLIKELEHNGLSANTQGQIEDIVTSFYETLYDNENESQRNTPNDSDDDFFSLCPKLSSPDRNLMEAQMSLQELQAALRTCKDSAPGNDGITYSFYKSCWETWGPILIKAWEFSMETGQLSLSNRSSIITLLPKEGKNLKEIGNWRPISLTNCDLKIITKALAIRMGKVADSLTFNSQTAYIRGRSVMDNLRIINYIINNDELPDRAIISLDAKKAFDSVDHSYIKRILKEYGFGPSFSKMFDVLYKDITAKILVNGHFTKPINIKRGVKQGDALSCIIFILCIDPLLRNIDANNDIEGIQIGPPANSNVIKIGGYADDVFSMVKLEPKSIQGVFDEYQRLTVLSGLELNANKTEILVCRLGNDDGIDNDGNVERAYGPIDAQAMPDYQRAMPEPLNHLNDGTTQFVISYQSKTHQIKSVSHLKICGIFFSKDRNTCIELNIKRKIDDLKRQLAIWKGRSLNLLAKILLVKTFGLSQIIYQMQCIKIDKTFLKEIETTLYKFIWRKDGDMEGRHVERIARKVMIKPIRFGGFGMIDIKNLDSALKFRQVLRVYNVHHPIKIIQGPITDLLQPFQSSRTRDDIYYGAREIIDTYALDLLKNINSNSGPNNGNSWVNSTNIVNLFKFLKVTGIPMMYAKQLQNVGKTNMGQVMDIVNTIDHPLKSKATHVFNRLNRLNKNIAQFVENYGDSLSGMQITHMNDGLKLTKINSGTQSKEIRSILDNRYLKTNEIITPKLMPDIDAPTMLVSLGHLRTFTSVHHRSTMLRLLNGDIFSLARLKRFKMVENDECERCGLKETNLHLLLECPDAANIWNKMAEILALNLGSFASNKAVSTFVAEINAFNLNKTRPKDVDINVIKKKLVTIISCEKIHSFKNNSYKKYCKIWKKFEDSIE